MSIMDVSLEDWFQEQEKLLIRELEDLLIRELPQDTEVDFHFLAEKIVFSLIGNESTLAFKKDLVERFKNLEYCVIRSQRIY